jgi:hypothetical protein
VDPYGQAAEKLKQFDAALKKEERIKEIKTALNLGWRELQDRIAKLPTVAAAVSFDHAKEVDLFCGQASNAKEAATIELFLYALPARSELLQALKVARVAFNETVEKSKATIKKLEDENLVFAKHIEEIVAIATITSANAQSEAEAKLAIDKFNLENDTLIKEAEAEKPAVARNLSFSLAYVTFRKKLLNYNASLPIFLAADLNEKTLKFYNEINKNDHLSERLKSLSLPTATGGKIEIEFENGQKCDALQVLSEGHIRCLGLAILLSKIISSTLSDSIDCNRMLRG